MQLWQSFYSFIGGSLRFFRPFRSSLEREDSCPISAGRVIILEFSLICSVVREQMPRGTLWNWFLAKLRKRMPYVASLWADYMKDLHQLGMETTSQHEECQWCCCMKGWNIIIIIAKQQCVCRLTIGARPWFYLLIGQISMIWFQLQGKQLQS